MTVGGYTTFRLVEAEDLAVFQEAAEGLAGVDFEPLIVATQIVAGTNYCFLCNATPVVLEPVPYLVKVTIHKPLPNAPVTQPYVLAIENV